MVATDQMMGRWAMNNASNEIRELTAAELNAVAGGADTTKGDIKVVVNIGNEPTNRDPNLAVHTTIYLVTHS
jgi:hypothetical protein